MFEFSADRAMLWFDVSNLVLLAGAVLVALGTFGTIKFSGIKEKFADERIAANEAETNRAVADSDMARQRIAELSTQSEALRKDTAEANARAKQAELDLAKLVAPRRLSPEQIASLIERAKKFADIPFDCSIAGDPEQVQFMEQIGDALVIGGWEWKSVKNMITLNRGDRPNVGMVTLSGVEIDIAESDMPKFEQAALALLNELVGAGIDAKASQHPKFDPGSIHIKVGTKPTAGK